MAPAEACRLALALGFDVSASVDEADYALQRGGIAAALADAGVREAFLAGDPVALAVFEWGGRRHQRLVSDWTMINDGGDLDRVATTVTEERVLRVWEPTAIGAALAFSLKLFERAPDCAAQTLDLSGDGQNNDWLAPERVYAREDFGGIVVNALAIGGHETDIAGYFARKVIRGPGAFVEAARTHADFPAAFLRKLLRELTGPVLGQAADADRRG